MGSDIFRSVMYGEFNDMIARGQYCPGEESMKKYINLPKEYFHPFEDAHMDFREAMEMTNENLKRWLPIGREISRFDQQYIKINRMIENAVTMLGRGLMTYHVNGIDPAEAPISIDELLSITSFHFRKCYMGARAASQSNVPAFLRLFNSQLRWLNIMERLERTRDKLAQPLPVRNLRGNGTNVSAEADTAPAGKSGTGEKALTAPDSFNAPASLGAPRNFRPYKETGLEAPAAIMQPKCEPVEAVQLSETAPDTAEGSVKTNTILETAVPMTENNVHKADETAKIPESRNETDDTENPKSFSEGDIKEIIEETKSEIGQPERSGTEISNNRKTEAELHPKLVIPDDLWQPEDFPKLDGKPSMKQEDEKLFDQLFNILSDSDPDVDPYDFDEDYKDDEDESPEHLAAFHERMTLRHPEFPDLLARLIGAPTTVPIEISQEDG